MFATIVKELKLLLRDPVGLLLLIFMPAILIIVMAVTQDSTFKDMRDVKFEVFVINKDQGKVGAEIVAAIEASSMFETKIYTDEHILRNDINSGKAKIGLIIPEEASSSLVNTANKVVNAVGAKSGLPASYAQNKALDSTEIEVLFDPTLKPSFKNSFKFALMQYATQSKMNTLMSRLGSMNGTEMSIDSALTQELYSALPLKEHLEDTHATFTLNSVQHNVPSWAIFGMFLIVVPIAGNMIREREEGSMTRLKLIPGAPVKANIGMILFYTLFCFLQFYVMMLIGTMLIPLFGLPKLYMGSHPWATVPLVLATAFCATTYGYLVGNVFKTANQAMPVGAIFTVILASLGGIWVPLEILPPVMTTVAKFTPMYWAFNGVSNIFLRGQGMHDVWLPIVIMLFSGCVMTLISSFISRRRIVN
jgi:ABC-2 type transport system permease protein